MLGVRRDRPGGTERARVSSSQRDPFRSIAEHRVESLKTPQPTRPGRAADGALTPQGGRAGSGVGNAPRLRVPTIVEPADTPSRRGARGEKRAHSLRGRKKSAVLRAKALRRRGKSGAARATTLARGEKSLRAPASALRVRGGPCRSQRVGARSGRTAGRCERRRATRTGGSLGPETLQLAPSAGSVAL